MEDVLLHIEADKKRRDGRLRWVLVGPEGITIRSDVPAEIVRAATASALSGGIGGRAGAAMPCGRDPQADRAYPRARG